ncbi:putative ATP-dependent endonuclease of OLD family [Jejuia pallidilutea]|uniref:Putative ATP-dependent endonuclease of OLD family n=1 Tax=Jejuia pallidilutea TaxID=504487 RepID=A0A362X9W6_9FLAO|nr:AAA family ATPase [Jejuia pallidilutea]PQV48821.1 putative ATP-dependent endonuclease of OLD family [Jejuia pallidilutea]
MHISSLSIRNFRNFCRSKFIFKKGINTILGENGSGKTNLFFALRVLIDDKLPRYIRFNESDFNRGLGKWAGHWMILSVTFEDLDASEEAQVLAVQSSGDMDGNKKTGSYSVYFRPKYQFRKELYDYSQTTGKTVEGLQLYLDKLTIDDYETSYLCRGTGDFSDDNTYKKYIGDFDNVEFPNPDDKEELIFGTFLPREISVHNEVSCTFIKALRDVESDLRSYSTNPLINLLRGKEKTVEVSKQTDIIESIDKLNDQISSLKEVKEVKDGIDKSIKEAVGTTYGPNIDVKSELPNDMEKLLQSLKLWVGDPDEEGYMGKIWELSLGGANMIYLSLKLLEYEKIRTDRIANFLLIEEPEAHIHTHIQKTLFDNVQTNRTQVIISTHSTHISSVSRISSVNILSRTNKQTLVYQPANNLDDEYITRAERYLDAIRSNLLFAKGVVLVEGDAEQILIPQMFKKVFGISLDEIGVSLVNIGSTGFKNVARLFHGDRIQKNCAILTDLDASIVDLPANADDDSTYEKHCRASEVSGAERKIKLDKFCNKNSFLSPFYSSYTFEVDVLMNGNSHEFIESLDEIFKQQAAIETSKKKLEDKSVSIAGVEVLRLADKKGKGWLALVVADNLVYNTYIPEYILKAVAFASSHLNNASKVKTAKYRLRKISRSKNDSYFEVASKVSFKGKEDQQVIDEYIASFPNDQFAKFLSYL